MTTARQAWLALHDGNLRFSDDAPEHPRQDAARRAETSTGQSPIAAVLGCSDSRASVEVAFDQGLGDVFVVRNAGQVADPSAVASLEYAVGVLGVPLVVVLGHERCGAVQAAIDTAAPGGPLLPALIDAHVDPIRPTVRALAGGDAEAVGRAHVEATVSELIAESELIADAIADGSVEVVGAWYPLRTGRVERLFAVGATS